LPGLLKSKVKFVAWHSIAVGDIARTPVTASEYNNNFFIFNFLPD